MANYRSIYSGEEVDAILTKAKSLKNTEIVDNLDSEGNDKALSANMGRKLKEMLPTEESLGLDKYALKTDIPTKVSLGLDKVDNTSDAEKYVAHAYSSHEASYASYADQADYAERATKDGKGNNIVETYATKGEVKTVESIAKGANQAVSFDNYAKMIEALNDTPADKYKIGQNIMIITLEVPDLWISGISETYSEYTRTLGDGIVPELKQYGSIQIGYYILSALETQKVDLTEYPIVSDLEYGVVVPYRARIAQYDANDNEIHTTYATLIDIADKVDKDLIAVTDRGLVNITDRDFIVESRSSFYELEEGDVIIDVSFDPGFYENGNPRGDWLIAFSKWVYNQELGIIERIISPITISKDSLPFTVPLELVGYDIDDENSIYVYHGTSEFMSNVLSSFVLKKDKIATENYIKDKTSDIEKAKADTDFSNVTDRGLANITEKEFTSNETKTITFTLEDGEVITEDMVGGTIADITFKDPDTEVEYTYLDEKDKEISCYLTFVDKDGLPGGRGNNVGSSINANMVDYKLLTEAFNSYVILPEMDHSCSVISITIEKEVPIKDKIATENSVNSKVIDIEKAKADKNLTNVTDQGLLNITEREFESNATQTIAFEDVNTITENMVGGIITDFTFEDINTGNRYTYLEEKDKVQSYDLRFYDETTGSIKSYRVGDTITSDVVGSYLIESTQHSFVLYEGIDEYGAVKSITIEKEVPIKDKIATENYVNEKVETCVSKASFVYDEETQTLNINI